MNGTLKSITVAAMCAVFGLASFGVSMPVHANSTGIMEKTHQRSGTKRTFFIDYNCIAPDAQTTKWRCEDEEDIGGKKGLQPAIENRITRYCSTSDKQILSSMPGYDEIVISNKVRFSAESTDGRTRTAWNPSKNPSRYKYVVLCKR